MSVGEDIYTKLTSDAGVSALVGTRIYPGQFRQQDTLPAIRYTRITSTNYHTMGVDAGVERTRYQFDMIDTTYAGVDAVKDAVKVALRRWRKAGIQDTYLISESDIFDDELQLHRVRLDVDIVAEV